MDSWMTRSGVVPLDIDCRRLVTEDRERRTWS